MPYPDLGSASNWLCREGIFFHVISMEFLRSLLRRRFARARVTTSLNVGRFLRLLANPHEVSLLRQTGFDCVLKVILLFVLEFYNTRIRPSGKQDRVIRVTFTNAVAFEIM